MSNFSTQFTFKIEIENSMCEITLAKSKGHIVIKIACPKSTQSLISISCFQIRYHIIKSPECRG